VPDGQANGGFADQSWIAILLIRLAFTRALLADFGPDLGLIAWGDPLSCHKNFGHSLRLYFNVFASPSKGWDLGKGTTSPRDPSREAFIIGAGASLACHLLTEGIQNKLHPTGYAKLFKDSEEVVSHRVLAHIELLGDLKVSHALGH
jgi:hypothetical protein